MPGNGSRSLRGGVISLFAASLAAGAVALLLGKQAASRNGAHEVSPALKIQHRAPRSRAPSVRRSWIRSIDGVGNHRGDADMGAAFTPLLRLHAADYADGVADVAAPWRPSARAISNAVNAQTESLPNPQGASDFLWQWGQFVDHDISLTGGTDPPEPADIPVPRGDPWFDSSHTGTAVIPFNRSLYDPDSGSDLANPRQQINEITAWIDGSVVYGSDPARAAALRTEDGTGRLKTSEGHLLPFNDAGLANAGGPSPALFLAGDVRANEQVALTALHTLFVREHNRLARRIARKHPRLGGDRIYQAARRIVGAELQVITYREFLPALLGPNALAPYRGYDRETDARIANVFSTAAYRFGHSLVGTQLLRLDRSGSEIPEGHLALRDGFFDPSRILDEGGIAPLLRGLAAQVCQSADPYVVDEVRNFLFGPPGAGGFDLPALNIQRGRDHGLPSYNDVRDDLHLGRAEDFSDISSDPVVQAKLASVYASVEDVDLWVGGLAEDKLPDSHLGLAFQTIVREQFEVLRDGDRFWYQRIFHGPDLRALERTRLSDVIRRNTPIGHEIPDDVFHVPPPSS